MYCVTKHWIKILIIQHYKLNNNDPSVPVYGVDYMCFIKVAILVFKMAVIKRKKIV